MLDDDVGHQLSVRVSFLVEAVNAVEVNLVGDDLAVVGSAEDGIGWLIDGDAPDPILQFADLAEFDSLLVPEGDLFVTARHDKVLTGWVELNQAWIETEVFISTDWLDSLAALDGEEGQFLVPGARDQQVVIRIEFLRAERECPHGILALLNCGQFIAILIAQKNGAIEEADREDLTVGGPVSAQALDLGLVFLDVGALSLPQAEIVVGARCQRLQHRVECKTLDLTVVGVSE